MKNLKRQFELNVQSKNLFSGANKVVVAISGGVDSTTLAELTLNYFENPQEHVYLAHVDHQLRKGSYKEKEIINKQFKPRGIRIFHIIWEKKFHPKSGLEGAARDFRYKFYKSVCEKIGASRVLLAQHANDQAETVLLKIIRGEDWSAISSIPWSRKISNNSNIKVVRPLLNIPKKRFYVYAKMNHLKWIEDSTNKDINYTSRNKIRKIVLPCLKKINNNAVSNIAGFARQINDLKNDQLIEMLKIWINHLDSSFPIKRSQLEQFKKLLNNKKKPYGEIRLAKKHFLVKKKDEVFFKNKNKKI